MHRRFDWATAAGFGAILLWSSNVAITRSLAEKIGPLQSGALIFAFSGVFLLALARLRHPAEIRQSLRGVSLRYALGCGGLFLLYTVSYYLAIGLARDRIQTIEVALLNYLWPSLTLFFSLFLLPMRSTWGVYPGMGLSLGGLFLVMTTGGGISWSSFAAHVSDNPVAYGAGLGAGVTWAFYSVLTRRWAPPGGGSVSLFLLISGLILMVPVAIGPAGFRPMGWQAIAETAVLVLFNAASYSLWDIAMRRGKVSRVAAGSYLTPVLSTLFSCAYLRVAPEPRVWVGSIVVVAGSLACWLSVRERPHPTPESPEKQAGPLAFPAGE